MHFYNISHNIQIIVICKIIIYQITNHSKKQMDCQQNIDSPSV